jgi:hypothetical protein
MPCSLVRVVAVIGVLVLAPVNPAALGQDALDTRVVPPIVDPVIVGTWHGKQHIFHPVRFEISAAVPRLIELLKDASPDGRSHAALALGNIREVPASTACFWGTAEPNARLTLGTMHSRD